MLDKYGNDLDYWYYCPICGQSRLPSCGYCPRHKKTKLVRSLYKDEYYRKLLADKGDYISSGFDVVTEQEIKTNPLFDEFEYKKRKDQTKPLVYTGSIYSEQNSNQPTCPTCHSTNIVKISDVKRAVHGIAWGFLSKTAFSQFECKNCGYKW